MTQYHRVRPFYLYFGLLTVLALPVVGCASSSPRPDSRPVQALTAERAPALDLPWPADTVAALRVESDGLDALFGTSRQLVTGRKPAADHSGLLERLVIGLLWDAVDLRQAFSPGTFSGGTLEGLGEGPAHLAFSTHGQADFLQSVRLGLPPLDAASASATLPDGLPARLILPAEAPKQLADSIRETCQLEETRHECPSIRAVAVEGQHVLVDLAIGRTFNNRPFTGADDGGTDAPDNPAGRLPDADARPFARSTPALRRFLTGGTSVAVYTRSDGAAAIATILDGLDLNAALASVAGPNRREVLSRGSEMLRRVLRLSDPGARQFEDLSVDLQPHDGQLEVALVQTYTAYGLELARAAGSPSAWSPAAVPPMPLALRWRYDARGAAEHLRFPDWMLEDGGTLRRGHRLLRQLVRGGAWSYAFVLAAHPDAMAAALMQELGPVFAESGLPVGGALGLGLVPEPRDASVDLSAFVSLVVPEAAADALEAGLEEIRPKESSLEASVSSEAVDKRRGSDGSFEAVTLRVEAPQDKPATSPPKDSTIVARLDLKRLADQTEASPRHARRFPRWHQAVFRNVGGMTGVLREGGEARTVRLRIGRAPKASGEDSPAALVPPRADVEPLDAVAREQLDDRVVSFGQTIRDGVQTARSSPSTRALDQLDTLAAQLHEATANEPEQATDTAEALSTMRIRLLRITGRLAESLGDLDRAIRTYETACQAGAEPACRRRDHLKELTTHFTWTRSDTAPASDALDGPTAFLTRRGLEFRGEVVLKTDALRQLLLSEADGERDETEETLAALDRTLSLSRGTGGWGISFAPGAHVSARLVAAVAQRGHQQRTSRRLLEQTVMLGQRRPPSGEPIVRLLTRRPDAPPPPGALLLHPVPGQPVPSRFPAESPRRSERGNEGRIPDRFVDTVEPDDQKNEGTDASPLHLVVSSKGIVIEMENGTLPPVDGCDDDEPTVCLPTSASETSVRLDEKRRAALEDGNRPVAGKYLASMTSAWPAERLREALADADVPQNDPPEQIIVRLEDDLPFALVADTLDELRRVLPTARIQLRGITRDSTP